MLADYHVHCSCSADCDTPPEAQVQAALACGLDELCFTDHVDMANRAGVIGPPVFDWTENRRIHLELQEKYGHRLALPLGAELGVAHLDLDMANRYLDAVPEIDFVIASQHHVSPRCGGIDLWDYTFPAGKTETMLADYFEDLLTVARWGRFSVMGHLTLPIRYLLRNGLPRPDLTPYRDQVDTLLKCLAESGLGLECNTSKGSGLMLPDDSILRRYRELGGEIITLGSDAHTPEAVGAGIREARELLRECGFRYVCTFRERKPAFHKL